MSRVSFDSAQACNMSLLDAAYNVVHDYPGGGASLGPRLGKSVTYLSNEVQGTGSAKLGLMDAQKITVFTGDFRILHAFAGNCGFMVVPLPDIVKGEGDEFVALARTAKEFGDLVTEVSGDLADGTITDNELARIDRESGELIASLHTLRLALVARNLAGKRS